MAGQVPHPVAEHVPSAAGWAQALSLGVTEAVTVPGETQPATDRTLVWCWQWHIPRCLTGIGTHQAGFDPAAVEISGFWHRLQRTKSHTAFVFALVLSGCSFASLWITRVFWQPEMWRIKAGVAVNKLLSL